MSNKRNQKNDSSDEENGSGSGSESDEKQTKGKRQREEKSDSKNQKRGKSSDDDNSAEEESKGEHAELFVKNMSYESSEKSLKSFFSKYGTVTNVKILKRDDGKSKGIGFVGFSSRKEAQSAIDDADNLNCDGRTVQVSYSNDKKPDRGGDRDRGSDRGGSRGGNDRGGDRGGSRGGNDSGNTVFMGNLSFKTSEDSIRKFFRDCGKIADIRIAKNPDGKMKGFCHVEFADTEAANSAVQKNGQDLDERQVKIDMSRPQGPSKIFF